MPWTLSVYDRLTIYKVIDFRHITKEEIAEINNDLQEQKYQVDKGLKSRERFASLGYLALLGGLVAAVVYKTMDKAN